MSYSCPPKLEFGQVFGRLIVLYVDPVKSVPKRRFYMVQCVCGKEFSTRSDALIRGVTVSCGCKKKEHNYRHGHRKVGTRDRTYHSWDCMLQRCTNPLATGYKYYGGRGLTVAKRWYKFAEFLKDMGPRPLGLTLERINNDKGYSKKNCKWATPTEQALNKRAKGAC